MLLGLLFGAIPQGPTPIQRQIWCSPESIRTCFAGGGVSLLLRRETRLTATKGGDVVGIAGTGLPGFAQSALTLKLPAHLEALALRRIRQDTCVRAADGGPVCKQARDVQ